MTLRDLTKRQLYNLRRRCEKERKKYSTKPLFDPVEWNTAFNKGLKAGLEIPRP